MIKLGKKGVNWVKNLPNYMRVLMELAGKSCLGKTLLKCIMAECQTIFRMLEDAYQSK